MAIKFALVSFPPFYQMGSRFLVAGLLLMAWLKWRGRALPTLVEWRNAAVIGTLLLVGEARRVHGLVEHEAPLIRHVRARVLDVDAVRAAVR